LEFSEAFNESQNGHHEQAKGLFTRTLKHNLLELFSKAFLSLTPVWCFPFTEQAEVSERLNDRRERT
jgi:hypothetical protein